MKNIKPQQLTPQELAEIMALKQAREAINAHSGKDVLITSKDYYMNVFFTGDEM